MVETPLRSSNAVAVSTLQRPGSTSAKATAGQAGRAPFFGIRLAPGFVDFAMVSILG